MMADTHNLFDPATRERVRRETARTLIVVFGVVTLVCAGMTALAHHEMPVLAWMTGACSRADFVYECDRARWDIAAGILGFVLFGGFATMLYRHRRIRPTVTCNSCGRQGWIMDLEPREGRCPRCGGFRFVYRITFAHGGTDGPIVRTVEEPDADGAALVRRFLETRHSWTDRYY